MNLNLWIALPEDVHNELNQGRGGVNNNLPDVARRFADAQLDPDVVQDLYATRTVGPNTWHLWSLILPEEDIVQQVNSFRQEYPGAQVMGLWKPDGAMYGCELVITEIPNPEYVGEPKYLTGVDEFGNEYQYLNPAWVPEFLEQITQTGTPQYEGGNLSPYMPDDVDSDGNPVPNSTVRDINLPYGWAKRVFA